MSDSRENDAHPTRAEIDAKLEAVEARTETRFARLEGKMDLLNQTMVGVANQMSEVKSDNKNTRWTIGITVAATMLAAIAALWTTQANVLTAFQTGLAAHDARPEQVTTAGAPQAAPPSVAASSR